MPLHGSEIKWKLNKKSFTISISSVEMPPLVALALERTRVPAPFISVRENLKKEGEKLNFIGYGYFHAIYVYT